MPAMLRGRQKVRDEMTVKQLKEALAKMPDDLDVLAGGEEANKVIVEECQGHKYVRIFKAWDIEYVGRGIWAKRR